MKKPWSPAPSPRASPDAAGTLPRTKTGGSESLIRGRISGPIPIPSPMDDEFPMRHPGTGIAKPLDDAEAKETLEPLLPDPEKQSPPSPTVSSSRVPVARNTTPEPETVRPPESRPGTILQNSPGRRTNRTNVSSTLRYSVISQDTSAQTGSSTDRPQRKKSILRGALGKLFGRKKKKSGSQSPISEEKPTQGVSNQHHSVSGHDALECYMTYTTQDPTALNRSVNNIDDAEPARSTSMPITEYSRALRSHSVGPEDVMAIESARNSLSADFNLSRIRSGGHLGAVRRTTDGGLTALSPRPASTHGRGSGMNYNNDDPEEIGRAITSDFSGLKRRSRSLSGLPGIGDDPSKLRRRSDEIRYWRESHGPLTSPISSNMPEGDYTGVVAFDMPEAVDLPPKTPPQPFTFGDIASMNEMAGMKITHAASMETRIGSLEARTRRLEKVVTQLCNAIPDFRPHVETVPNRPPPPDPPAGEPPAHTTTTIPVNPFAFQTGGHDAMGGSTRPSTRHSEMSKLSSVDAPTFVGSYHRHPIPQTFSKRPLSTATIRGAASLPTLSREMAAPFTIDHYMTLMALIDTERSARQALEAEVRRLSHQVNLAVRSSVYGRTTLGSGPLTGHSLGETSAFDDDDDDDDAVAPTPKRGSVLPEDSGIGTGHDGDEVSEPFATPREDSHSFSPVDQDEDEAKKAARIHSLSQLTYNTTPLGLTQQQEPQPI